MQPVCLPSAFGGIRQIDIKFPQDLPVDTRPQAKTTVLPQLLLASTHDSLLPHNYANTPKHGCTYRRLDGKGKVKAYHESLLFFRNC